MLFREASFNDIEEITQIYLSLIDSETNRWGNGYPSLEIIENDIRNRNMYVLEENEKLIASASLGKVDDLSDQICWSENFKNPCELARLGLKKDFQGKGLAKVFLNYLEKEAFDLNFDSIHLIASTTNPRALFYMNIVTIIIRVLSGNLIMTGLLTKKV